MALPYCYSACSLYSANRDLTPADISYIVDCARDYNSDLLKDSTVVSDPRRVFRGGSPYSDIAQRRFTDFRQEGLLLTVL